MRIEPALAAFDTADVSVGAALAHLHAPVDRPRLLALRRARLTSSVEEAQRILASIPSAILELAFVAEPYAACGAHEKALASFLDALARVPRWDSALAARALSGMSGVLTALGRAEEAVAVSARALRFMPAEPRTVASHAAALEAAGRARDAAAHFAWLHDVGVGKAVLARDVSDLEREVEGYAPDVAAVEPLDDEAMARHLVFTYADLGLANHMLQGRRHAMACLRHGAIHAALGTLEAFAGGTPNAVDAGRWLGWPVGASDYAATDALLASVEARAKTQKRDRAAKDLGHKLPGARIAAVEKLVAEGKPELAREGLFDRVATVRFHAARALPEDPIVARMRAIEAGLDPVFRLLDGEAPADTAHHGGTSLVWNGTEVVYPPCDPEGPPELHAPHIELAENARAKCKVCKTPIEAGALRLRVRHKFFPVETFYTHLPCAAGGKRGPLLGASKLERDEGPLLLTALRRSRRVFPEREALLAQLTR